VGARNLSAGAPVPRADDRTLILIVYVLYAFAFVAGISAIVAVIMDYVKRDDVRGTWLESHVRWQIRTFWFALLWGAIGAVLLLVLVGWFVLVADAIWYIYRIVKGVLRLNDGRPMYERA